MTLLHYCCKAGAPGIGERVFICSQLKITFLWYCVSVEISRTDHYSSTSDISSDMRMSCDCRWRWECVQFGPSAVVTGSRAVLTQPLDQHERSPLRRVFRRPSSHPSGSAGVTAGRWGEIMGKTVGIKISIWISWQAQVCVRRCVYVVCWVSEVDSTCSDFDFGTALHIAASNLCTSAVKCLLELGANPAFRVCDFRLQLLTKQTAFFVSFSSFYCYCISHAHYANWSTSCPLR